MADSDGVQRDDRAREGGARADAAGAVDLPEDPGGLGAVDEHDVAQGGRRHGSADLEHEDGVRVALTVERDGRGVRRGAGDRVQPGRDRRACECAGEWGAARTGGDVRVRREGVGAGLRGGSVADVERARDDAGREAGRLCVRDDPEVASQRRVGIAGGADGVADGRAAQCRVRRCGAQRHHRRRCGVGAGHGESKRHEQRGHGERALRVSHGVHPQPKLHCHMPNSG